MLFGSRALRWLTPLLLVAAELSFGIPVSVGNIETAKLLKEATLVLKGEFVEPIHVLSLRLSSTGFSSCSQLVVHIGSQPRTQLVFGFLLFHRGAISFRVCGKAGITTFFRSRTSVRGCSGCVSDS